MKHRISEGSSKNLVFIYKRNALLWLAKRIYNREAEPDEDLKDFIYRTLLFITTGTFAEKSFNKQIQIRTKEGKRLKPSKVQRISFCRWNIEEIILNEKTDKKAFFNFNYRSRNVVEYV